TAQYEKRQISRACERNRFLHLGNGLAVDEKPRWPANLHRCQRRQSHVFLHVHGSCSNYIGRGKKGRAAISATKRRGSRVLLESMFRIIFWAVPAFIRVEPEITSGPTSATIARSAAFSRGELRLQVTAIVLAPRRRAYSSAATVNGVRPLAAIPTTTSCFWSF